jgi:ornithine cyclodeaminase/alanine dehydrogenase-like protein (mu-crystallin family)
VSLLVLSAADVRRLLPYDECTAAMREVLVARQRGTAQMPLRTVFGAEGAPGMLGLMPGYLPGIQAGYGVKAICIYPGNPARGLDTHQGVVLLAAADTGEPVALLNASAVTEIRTAAVSAAATDALARQDADTVAIIGTGVQARSHVLALAATRTLAGIRVAGREPGSAAAFASRMQAQTSVPVRACACAREAVEGAGIIVTATSSAQPVLDREWIAPGTHVNAVGACLPGTRELDSATMAGAALFADSRQSVATESGDYLIALAEGSIKPGHVRAELGEVLAGAAAGRRGDEEITVFESLGLAVEDLAAAALVYRKARAAGAGTSAEFS